jgi:hypothetical protein
MSRLALFGTLRCRNLRRNPRVSFGAFLASCGDMHAPIRSLAPFALAGPESSLTACGGGIQSASNPNVQDAATVSPGNGISEPSNGIDGSNDTRARSNQDATIDGAAGTSNRPTCTDGSFLAGDYLPVCSSPLGDFGNGGFTKLADVPIATLCHTSTNGYPDAPYGWKMPCQGSVLVGISTGVETSRWWLFDVSTGDIEAVGYGSPAGTQCGVIPGFSFPGQCFCNSLVDLCEDAGADAAVTDAGGRVSD